MAKKGKSKPRATVGDPTDREGFAVLLCEYATWMRTQNYSKWTVERRERNVGFFIVWCEARAVKRPCEVTRPILERYARYLYYFRKESGEPMSFGSQHARLVPLRMFFKWLTKRNYLLWNPASELELPKVEQRLPKHVLTMSEMEQVLSQPNVDKDLGIRDRAILETLYSTGMRRMEVISLRIYDLDVERKTVVIRQGKGKKDRTVPIGERALDWIDRYITDVRPTLVLEPDDGTLYLTNVGESFCSGRLSGLVGRYVSAANLGKTGSCHLFRHSMATLMLEGGADIRYIQQMLGHAQLDTTQIYTQVSIRRLKRVHELTHPSAKRGRRQESDDGDAEQEESVNTLLLSLAAEAEEEKLEA